MILFKPQRITLSIVGSLFLILCSISNIVYSADTPLLGDGTIITLQADTGKYAARCNGCLPGEAYPDNVAIQVTDPSKKYAQFKVKNVGNGKVTLRADTGKYAARCRGCVPGETYPDSLMVHVTDPSQAFAQFKVNKLSNGKFTFQADTGKYVSRCRGCFTGAAYEDNVTIHIDDPSGAPYAQWSIANIGSAITTEDLQAKGYPFPANLTPNANHTQLANYAWRLFIASNQLTTASLKSGAGRGVGSSSSNFIDTGKATSFGNPLVFESLYHRTEAFPYYTSTKPASPIDQVPTYYSYSLDAEENRVAFTVTGQNYVNLDETNQISQNFLYYRQSNGPDFPVLFMAKVNDIETNYVRDKAKPSADSSFVFPNDVLEIKTAWRRVRDIKNSDANKYHQATATYYVGEEDSGNPTIKTDTFALIAIHIIQKTENYQSFIFTTFEHVDAVTRDGSGVITDPAYELTYTCLAYNNSSDTIDKSICEDRAGTIPTASANGAYDVNEPGLPPQSDVLTTYNLPVSGPKGATPGYHTIVQPKTITKEVNDVNNQVGALIKSLDPTSIWANYRLKGVQAVPTSDQDTLDYYLANIVVESSQPGIQLFRGGAAGGVPTTDGVFTNNRSNDIPYAPNVSLNLVEGQKVPDPTYTMGGCMGCHGRAQQKGRDFSFLAQASAGNGKEVDSVPSSNMTLIQRHLHNVRISKSGNSQ